MRAGWMERGSVAIRLGRPHFAFYRGYLDGLDLGELADRYLAGMLTADDAGDRHAGAPHVDLRRARSMLRWIRAQLQAAARRDLRPADARLLGVSPGALLAPVAIDLPTLDQFREEQDPDGLYAEAELISLFSQAYPTARSQAGRQAGRQAARNQRLRLRQQRALARLEQLTAADPRPADPVDAWLDAALAARLSHVGLASLADLLAFIDRHGYRWYRKVPRVGLQAARHIAGWLQQESVRAALGCSLGAHVLQPARMRLQAGAGRLPPGRVLPTAVLPAAWQAGFSLAGGPLNSTPGDAELGVSHGAMSHANPDAATLPALLARAIANPASNGAHGGNRGKNCQLKANDDWAAIEAWLSARDPAAHTLRAYRREAERFMLWAWLECAQPISGMRVEDCKRYGRFLSLLGASTAEAWSASFRTAQDAWIGPRGVLRSSKYWRPFHGPLGAASQRQALVIIQSLMQWLYERNYLNVNPMPPAARGQDRLRERSTDRALTATEWESALAVLPTVLLSARQASTQSHDRGGGRAGLQHVTGSAGAGWAVSGAQVAASGRGASTVCPAHRLHCIIGLAADAGLRLSEIVRLRRRNLTMAPVADTGGVSWQASIVGRGGAVRNVTLAPELIAALTAYLATRGSTLASMAPAAPLIASLQRDLNAGASTVEKPLSPQRIYCLVKQAMANAALHLAPIDKQTAERLNAASPERLRRIATSQVAGKAGQSFALNARGIGSA